MALSWKDSEYRCMECGAAVVGALARLGSVLCHDCRDEHGVDVIVVRNVAAANQEGGRGPGSQNQRGSRLGG